MLRLLLLAVIVILGVEGTRYTGESVYRIIVENEQQIQYLRTLQDIGMDFWTEIHFGSVDVRINQNDLDSVMKGLKTSDIQVFIKDLDGLCEESKTWMNTSTSSRSWAGHRMDWTSYHIYEDMQGYMQYLADNFQYVSVKSIGKSYKGADMQVLEVCKGGCGNKPAIWIDGGIHAREWISPATVTFMMNELVENDAAHTDLTESFDWYILPVMNPDGYAHTLNDRLWRKTMSGVVGSNNCFGTDANRNWGYQWNTGGSSNDTCSINYMGPSAFSEVENRNVRDFIWERKDKIKFFNTIHSYGEMVLLPWGFTREQPPNYAAMEVVAQLAADEIYAVHGKIYKVDCVPCLFDIASGSSLDWALGTAGIPYSFGMELRDSGIYGHILPPDQIIPTGEEIWAFHLTMARVIIDEFDNSSSFISISR